MFPGGKVLKIMEIANFTQRKYFFILKERQNCIRRFLKTSSKTVFSLGSNCFLSGFEFKSLDSHHFMLELWNNK